eukprot:11306126-Karenia_brevis.AAC.1
MVKPMATCLVRNEDPRALSTEARLAWNILSQDLQHDLQSFVQTAVFENANCASIMDELDH